MRRRMGRIVGTVVFPVLELEEGLKERSSANLTVATRTLLESMGTPTQRFTCCTMIYNLRCR